MFIKDVDNALAPADSIDRALRKNIAPSAANREYFERLSFSADMVRLLRKAAEEKTGLTTIDTALIVPVIAAVFYAYGVCS